MRSKTISILAAVVAGAALLPATAGAAVRHVTPGHSIQSAIDRSHPGDEVLVAPGVYRENLTITTDGITLRGAGDSTEGTVLMPPATPHDSICNEFGEVNGICVTGQFEPGTSNLGKPIRHTQVSGFLVQGFTRMGILFYNAIDTRIDHSRATGGSRYGIVGFSFSGVTLTHDVADDNGQGGIHIGDADNAQAVIADNSAYGNHGSGGIGIFLRDVSHGVVWGNHVDGNCAGILFAGTQGKPLTHWLAERNTVTSNNLACSEVEGGGPPLSGLGMALLGTEGALVRGNVITGNQPTEDTPLIGGLLVASATPIGGVDPTGNTVTGNRIHDNAPADVLYDGSGTGNVFTKNDCGSSSPAALCGN